MAEATLEPGAKAAQPRLTLGERLRRNPVALKETRIRMRGRRAFVSLTIYLLFLSGFVSLVYLASSAATAAFGSPRDWQDLGKTVFASVVGLELFMMCFIAPGATAGAISSERERQTFDVLRTTLLSARSLVLGKLASALSYLLLLLLAAIPLQSLAFLFGGVTPEEVLIGTVLLVVTAVTFSAVGLFCSSLMKRTQSSTVLAYVLALFLTIGLPLIVAVLTPLLMRTALAGGSLANASLSVSLYWLLLSLSPLSAAIFTASNLATERSIFTASPFAGSGNTIELLSPWVIYTIAYVLLSALLVALTIRNIKRPEK